MKKWLSLSIRLLPGIVFAIQPVVECHYGQYTLHSALAHSALDIECFNCVGDPPLVELDGHMPPVPHPLYLYPFPYVSYFFFSSYSWELCLFDPI